MLNYVVDPYNWTLRIYNLILLNLRIESHFLLICAPFQS